jgi:hypothetical protein
VGCCTADVLLLRLPPLLLAPLGACELRWASAAGCPLPSRATLLEPLISTNAPTATLAAGLSIPDYFSSFAAANGHGPVNTGSATVNNILNSIFSTPAAVALMTCLLLDLTIPVARGERAREAWQRQRWAVLHARCATGAARAEHAGERAADHGL